MAKFVMLKYFFLMGGLVSLFLSNPKMFTAEAASASQVVTFCVGTENIDFYPFTPMNDPRRLTLLWATTKSYISNTQSEEGILESWSFSKDGKILTAKVSKTATWQDGSQVSSKDAAFGIAKGITFRELGEKVRVSGTEKINTPGWSDRTYSGIQILGNDTFELHFEAQIENIAGVVREALSTSSRHNRMWPARLSSVKDDSYGAGFDLVSKFPITKQGSGYFLNVDSIAVELQTVGQCKSADLNQFVQFIKDDYSNYTIQESHSKQTMIAVFNSGSGRLETRAQRLMVANLLRSAIGAVDPFPPQMVSSHFVENEAGSGSNANWGPSDDTLATSKIKELKIVPGNKNVSHNVFGKAIDKQAKDAGIKIIWLSTDTKLADADVFLNPTRIEGGRQVWLQDLLSHSSLAGIFQKYPKTEKALTGIRQKSASTVPPDKVTLQAFDSAAFDEASIAPVGRFGLLLFSKKSSPIELAWTPQDELTFRRRGSKQ